jgi:hypothetical protein
MSTLKVLPLVGVLAFLVIPVGWPRKARTIAAAVVAFAALHLINAVISGSYTVSLVKATLGQIPHQPALFSESGGLNNPNFIDFVFALFHTFNVDKATLVSSALAFCFLILGVVIAMLAQKTREMDDYAAVRIFGLAALCACFCCSGSNLTPSAPWCRLRSRRSHFQAASCDVSATSH